MLIYPHPIPAIVSYQANTDSTPVSLVLRDPLLKTEIPAQEVAAGTIRDLAKWVRTATGLFLGTSESEMLTAKDTFLFGTVRAGDLMEAYSTLYRLRWVKFKHGKPTYELTLATDIIDRIYEPHDACEKKRFQFASAFLRAFDTLDADEKARVLSGESLDVADLPPNMRASVTGMISSFVDAPDPSAVFSRTSQSVSPI